MAPGTPDPTPAASFVTEGLLHDLMEVSLTAVNVLRPVYGPTGDIVDFTLEYLNPAAQRMSHLPERPGGTLLSHRPHTVTTGILDYYRRAFETGTTDVYEVNYQAEGLDNYFRLAARRSGEWLVVSFTDTSDQPRTSVEMALREAQAAEKAARADAEAQRQRFHDVLVQLPAYIAVYRGPDHVYQFVNPPYQSLFPHRSFAGRPFREGIPEADGLGVVALFDRVYQTGEPYYAREMEGQFDFHGTGSPEQVFLNLSLYPLRDTQGRIDGVLDFSYNVTEQVRARRQVEHLNEELEARVQERTREALALQANLLAAARQQADQRAVLYQVFEQTPAPVALLRGPGHRFEYVNPAYQAFFPGGPLAGREVADVAPELVAQGFGAQLDRVYNTGETFSGVELPFAPVPVNGEPPRTRYFTFTYQAYREHDRTVGVSIFAYDVTEQVHARREREAEREQLHELFLQAPAPIVILDGPALVFQLINPAYQRIFPGRDLLNKPLLKALPELVGTPIPDLFRDVYQTGEPVTVHELPLRMARHEGAAPEDIYWTFTYQARRDAHGTIDGVRVFAHDVTEPVRARQRLESYAAELQESEARFRTMADAAPNLVWAVHPDASLRYVNRAFLAFLGLPTVEAFAAIGWGPTIHPEDLVLTQQTLGQAMAERRPYALEHRMRGHDGQYRWLLSQGAPSYLAGGELYGYVGASLDITDLKHANQQLTRTNVDLDNFIYTASHDLKAPISNIEGLLDTLRDELPPPAAGGEVPYILDLMQDSVNRFTRTIEHLTDVSRLQKEHDPPREPVALAGVLEDVRLDLAPLLQQTGGRLDVDVRAVPTVQFSVKNLRSVAYNLLSNALKYRHPDRAPLVRVRGREEGAYHVLEVQDNGLGLDLTRGPELFGMFRRYHTHVDGSGIGLYMVKRMVENTGGRIAVDSTPGEGSTFTVYFPRP